jgi:septal ring factor EnvC (AmiA/AmiB activator)
MDIFNELDAGNLILEALAMVAFFITFKATQQEKTRNLEKRDEEKDTRIKELEVKLNEVKETANATANYAKDSEQDRKKVMEEFLPKLTNSIDGVNVTLQSILKDIGGMKKDIHDMRERGTEDRIKLEKFIAVNQSLNTPDEN